MEADLMEKKVRRLELTGIIRRNLRNASMTPPLAIQLPTTAMMALKASRKAFKLRGLAGAPGALPGFIRISDHLNPTWICH
jgi:hypothetical protein